MKTKVFYLLFVFSALSVTAQRGIRIGYVDMEYILQNVEEYKEANTQLNNRVQKWKVEVEEQKGTIEQMRKDLSAEKVLLTKELAQEREDEIKALEAEMLQYQQDRFGPEGDLVQQKRMLVQPIQDQVFTAVQEIATNRNYDFIFDKSADVVMLYSDKRHDVSEMVLRSINRNRKQDERNGKKPEVINTFDDDSTTEDKPKVSEERQELEKTAQELRDEKQQKIEEQRQAKLKEIEERKKAYEERRKKILEEREARRKELLEKRNQKNDSIQKKDDAEDNN